MELYNFLRKRGIPETTVNALLEEKIDCSAVNGITDLELSRYITRKGDRIAVRQYCKTEVYDTGEISKAAQSLREKLKLTAKKLHGNYNSIKTKRSFQLGLFEEKKEKLMSRSENAEVEVP